MRKLLAALVTAMLLVPAMVGGATVSASVNGAAFTTDDPAVANPCLNGPGHTTPSVDCNIYTAKEDVWINGGPSNGQNHLSDGTYFFAVLVPGGQPDPNDGGAKNLSDTTADPYPAGSINADSSAIPSGDDYTNRVFTVSGGHISSYSGTHLFDTTNGGALGDLIQLAPYDDTTNPGGVYILAICQVPSSPTTGAGAPGANPSGCKYDAFKVKASECTGDCVSGQGLPLDVIKDAAGSDTNTYGWTLVKSVDKNRVEQIGGSATFNYTVTATYDNGTISDVKVTGTIDVFNPNSVDVTGVDVTDQLSDLTNCTVTNGSNQTIAPGDNYFAYECDLSALPQGELDNTATATWGDQTLVPDGFLPGGSADFVFTDIAFTETTVDNCITVTDTFNGGSPDTLGTICVGNSPAASNTNLSSLSGFSLTFAAPTFTFKYSRTITVPANDCKSYSNQATFTSPTSLHTGTSNQVTVTVCGPANTGALTMGFWQNKNGQGIIKAGVSTSGACNSGTFLRLYAPFQDLLAGSTCTQVATYVYNVIKAAVCTSTSKTCNSMLKAQDLATSLDVYFSDPALGGNKIGAPAPIGAVKIDLTKVCNMIDGSGGTATCSGTFLNASSAFGGATCLSVSDIMAYAASQSNVGGSTWYGQVKATQVLAKNVFDAINNKVAFSC